MPWNPDVYHKFQAERSAPFVDLLNLIDKRPGLNGIDLGCGTGELTRQLAEALPQSTILGVDNSAEMLKRAETFASDNVRFKELAIEAIQGQWDLIFSHAALHWVEDHETLFPRLMSMVAPGGQLAVQMPSNHTHLTHVLIRELAAEAPFYGALNGWTRQSPVLGVDRYAEILYESGGRQQQVLEKVYPHLLADSDAVADWVSGTTLVPYFERLTPDLRDLFMQRYRERLRQRWPQGPVFYGFRRTLFVATRE